MANITGGAGNDNINLYGQTGSNTVDGGDGDDEISGGIGDDTLIGGAGNDFLFGDQGNNILYGGPGNDTLKVVGSTGSNEPYGGLRLILFGTVMVPTQLTLPL
jgi:Ca2+-binding RTX toxin-like protein